MNKKAIIQHAFENGYVATNNTFVENSWYKECQRKGIPFGKVQSEKGKFILSIDLITLACPFWLWTESQKNTYVELCLFMMGVSITLESKRLLSLNLPVFDKRLTRNYLFSIELPDKHKAHGFMEQAIPLIQSFKFPPLRN